MDLLLIRHAEPVRIEAADGPADPSLAARGRSQAERLANWLDAELVDAIWSSPMRRAVETAEPLANGKRLPVEVEDGLAEFDRAATSYIPIEELKATRDERWLAMVAGRFEDSPVDPADFRSAVVGAVERVISANPGRTVAVVAHGGVINAYVGHVLGIEHPLWFEPRYTSITRVAAARSGIRSLTSLNETAHLRGTDLLQGR